MSSDNDQYKDGCKDDNLVEIEIDKCSDKGEEKNEHQQFNKQINYNKIRQTVIIKHYPNGKIEVESDSDEDKNDEYDHRRRNLE
jgi:hypothetical protein